MGFMDALNNKIGGISAKNYDYLIGDEYKFNGSVMAGGISYSGADIKVVMSVQNPLEEKFRKYQGRMDAKHDALDQELNNANDLRRNAEALAARAKAGTKEERYAFQKLNSAIEQQDKVANTRQTYNEEEQRKAEKVRNMPKTAVLAEAQTISITSFRDKAPVRSLGSVYPKGYVRGPRQIGGSIVFTVFDRDVFFTFLEANPSDFDGNRQSSAVLDQMPPVDIIMSFANEMGAVSRMVLYGVEFVSSGQIMSIEDILTENTVEYVARDFDPMSRVGVQNLNQQVGDPLDWQSTSASSLIREADSLDVKGYIDPFERFKRRNNKFL